MFIVLFFFYVGCLFCVIILVKDCSMLGRNRDDVFFCRWVNKMLVFEGDDGKCIDVVDLFDSEIEEGSVGEEECEDEDVEVCEGNINVGCKRKWVIMSDLENDDNDDDDDEDNIFIVIFKNLK